jgi:VPDSG-CTERM motif
MKRYVLCALAAVALAVNAEAVPKDKDKPPVVEVSKDKDKDNYNGPVASVPDNGNTVLLLGTAVLALGIASRRFATR